MKTILLLLIFHGGLLLNSSIVEGRASGVFEGSMINVPKLSATKQEVFAKALLVKKCNDFSVTGLGNSPEWKKAEWTHLTKLDSGGINYESKYKILYSALGIYVLFYGEDDKITTKDYKDFEAIYNGDVFEIFFHPSAETPVYFEYEVNQLSRELILTLSKTGERLYSWAPKYPTAEERKPVKKAVSVTGDTPQVGSSLKNWTAEVFIPYEIMGILPNTPPKSGTIWNANFCRLDYDSGNMIKWSWSPRIQKSFHEIDKFLSIQFE
ncbi:MAG TPA: carbohydrate-binding family 9-like protein [Segetibacter sp.]